MGGEGSLREMVMLPAVLALLLAGSPGESERVDYVVSKLLDNGVPRQEVEALFRDPRLTTYAPRVIRPRKIEWDRLIARLVSPESVSRGSRFLAEHDEVLTRAEEKFGVAKEILAGILRIESNFGNNTGRYITFNVFYTALLGSTEEKRWKWAAANLVSLVAYCRTAGMDCFEVRGSYAGAMGPAQFLPVSLEMHGADSNGDNLADPFDTGDAIFSAANFLAANGWRENKIQALGKYYGSAEGYPRAVLAYAEALGRSSR